MGFHDERELLVFLSLTQTWLPCHVQARSVQIGAYSLHWGEGPGFTNAAFCLTLF